LGLEPIDGPHADDPTKAVEVVDYDDTWPETFRELCDRAWAVLADVALSIEHVGSTSVPGLAAKPVIDMCVVVASPDDVPEAIDRLASIGYAHRGNLGIEGREAFTHPSDLPRHHLYLSPRDALSLRNHLALRDHLRADPDAAAAYGALKKRLADAFPDDIEGYVDGKTEMIIGLLEASGLPPDELRSIEAINRRGAARAGLSANLQSECRLS
jgi:GrpB-like predicted nucleotidyltransferase (UPF0157 family)